MSTYRYGDNSVVKEIAVRKSAGRGVRSFLYLSDKATPEQVDKIKQTLVDNDWHCVPTEINGACCLEVRGPRKIDALEDSLRAARVLGPQRVAEIKDDKKISAKEKFKSNMLLVYGIMNVVADIGMIGYGWLKDNKLKPGEKLWENTAAGIAYSAGSVTFAAFGRGDKSDHHMRDIAAKLRDQLHNDGIAVPSGSALDTFDTRDKPDAPVRFKRFMHKHSAEFGNGFTALAGAFLAKGAMKSTDSHTKAVDLMLGLSTLTAGTTAAAVKEKAPDPNDPPPHGFFARAKQWVETRPNRVAGIGYGISSLAHAYEVITNIKTAEKDYNGFTVAKGVFKDTPKTKIAYWAYGMRGGFVVMNLLAEGVLASASKGGGEGVKSDKSVDQSAYALVADTIIRQPPELREKLYTELSRNFLAKPEVLGGNAAEIEKALRARVKNLENNPWLGAAPAGQAAAATVPEETTRWRGKVAAAAQQQSTEPVLAPAF